MIAEGPGILRRLQVVSQMRDYFLEVRRSTQARHETGQHPYPPPYDIRSDANYWRQLAEQRTAEKQAAGKV